MRKPIKDQVIVVTGAGSETGRATSFEASKRGAKVILISRHEMILQRLSEEIEGRGGLVAYFCVDVADSAQVDKAAELAFEKFGGFDTWINNSSPIAYGRMNGFVLEEEKGVFARDFWGMVHGCNAAIRHLAHRGGTIINVENEPSVYPPPLGRIYYTCRAAVKAYSEALQTELEALKAPISISVIQPSLTQGDVARAVIAAAENEIPESWDENLRAWPA